MKHLLPKLTAALEQFKEGAKQLQIAPYDHIVPEEKSDIISHEWFWPRVAHFFRPKDVIVSETGTANFGLLDVPVSDTILIPVWTLLISTSSRKTLSSWRRYCGAVSAGQPEARSEPPWQPATVSLDVQFYSLEMAVCKQACFMCFCHV
jgi:hypothetical protein